MESTMKIIHKALHLSGNILSDVEYDVALQQWASGYIWAFPAFAILMSILGTVPLLFYWLKNDPPNGVNMLGPVDKWVVSVVTCSTVLSYLLISFGRNATGNGIESAALVMVGLMTALCVLIFILLAKGRPIDVKKIKKGD